MSFPIITEAKQTAYETDSKRYNLDDHTPEICGIYGRACRQMNSTADRVLCHNCGLKLFAESMGDN